MVGGVIRKYETERIPGKIIAAVIEDGLDGRPGEKPQGLPHGHAREEIGQTGAQGVHDKALQRVVVEGAVRVGDI